MKNPILLLVIAGCFWFIGSISVQAQIGTPFPSERKVVKDPVTGILFLFLKNG